MAINKQSIISVFDDKLTLLQWLKTINKALDEAVLTGVEVRQKGNATFTFVVTFEDGTELESNEFVLAQGESINGATIRNGHLYLSLTNGNELDAGNVKPVTSFEINASQHLIVNYGDGTSQDLGAIFSGNVNVDGNFTANSIIENMSGYRFQKETNEALTYTYAGICKNGNKITFAIACKLNFNSIPMNITLGTFILPISVYNKLFPMAYGQSNNILSVKAVTLYKNENESKTLNVRFTKSNYAGYVDITLYPLQSAEIETNTDYILRYEETFLLSDNMAGN